jgi:shikimate dehydrogenase
VAHSLSPTLHTAAYTALDLPGWSYGRAECDETGLPAFVAGLGPEWAGLSLTMPLKRVALDVADEVAPLAAQVGAANTLVATPGGWAAHNTDVAGIVEALREAGLSLASRAIVLGAGGTAQAALAALRILGVREPTVVVRSAARAGELLATAARLDVHPVVLDGYPAPPLPVADVVISTLPPGAARPRAFAAGTVVMDVVYAPWPTPFARAARDSGCRVVSGLAMLLHQAVAQVELMTGRTPPVEPMRAALLSAAAAR